MIWPARKILEPGHKNVKHHSLVESSRILLPPLHIKLGLMKSFVKAMDHNGIAFLYLRQKFPLLSDAKIWESVFSGPDMRSLLHNEVFEQIITGDEQRALHAFREVVTGFLGNRRADNYKDLVEELLSSYQKLGCNMSLKIHFLEFSPGLLSWKLWFCEWRARWTFSPGLCSNGGQIQREMEPINACWLLLDLDAWFSKFDVQSVGEEGPIALQLYATFDLRRSTGKRRYFENRSQWSIFIVIFVFSTSLYIRFGTFLFC